LIDEIKASEQWSILIDESITITNEKYLVIVSKYISNNIVIQIKNFLIEKELQVEDIAHFKSNRISTMID